MENLPLERYTFFDLVNVTPRLWTGSGEASSRSIALGGMVESNAYQFEGVDVSAPEYGAAWPWINPLFLIPAAKSNGRSKDGILIETSVP